jgi:diguanylate cyclase (GGDEF)-like protein
MCGRIGGNEFLLALAGVQAAREGIRKRLQNNRFTFRGDEVVVTASFAISDFRRGETPNLARLVEEADDALYAAKRLGRNRVEAVPTEAHESKLSASILLPPIPSAAVARQ